jgi:acid phosphatase
MKRLGLAAALAVAVAAVVATTGMSSPTTGAAQKFSKIDHLVVIYEENHSFDNLYGGWEGVNGRQNATNTTQVGQTGSALACLKELDVNLVAAGGNCWANALFNIDQYIPADAKTCPPDGVFAPNGYKPTDPGALPGGCTRDIVHRFYQEQYQLDGGKQDRYAVGSDAGHLVMGYYDTTKLPIYQYLHGDGHPHYAILDNFFQGAFGGSFLNHQFLIAAQAPVDSSAGTTHAANHSKLDSAGFPNATYPMYTPLPNTTYNDSFLTQACNTPTTVAGLACGDFAVNTMQPASQPTAGGASTLPLVSSNNIGDELSSAGVSWAWYSGGWDDAAGITNGPGWTNGNTPGTCTNPNSKPNPAYPYCPNKNFQYHHQPFNFFANYAPGTPGRAHLLDEEDFINAANGSTSSCNLDAVSFIKPVGDENEHPGYASEANGSNHLVDLLQEIEGSACAKNTMVVVTYDEFGGQYDHVAPPGPTSTTAGPHDLFGPGTRVPALVLAPNLRSSFSVDSTEHDTTSILATIEHRWSLTPIGADTRDGRVNDLSTVFDAHPVDTTG